MTEGSSFKVFGSVGVLVFGLLMVVLFGPVVQVDAGHVGVKTTWGAVSRDVLHPGISFKTPFAEAVTTYDVRNQRADVDAAAASKDLQEVNAKIALIFHPIEGEVMDLHNQTGPEYATRVVAPAIQEAFKATTAQYTANELITKREEVKIKARDLLTERLARFHIRVEDLNIVNFDFSKDFNAAIEAANVARQQVVTAEQTLERQRVEAQLRVAQAEADANAAKAAADGAAYARLTNAKAEAESIRAIAQANADGFSAQVRAFGSAGLFVDYTKAKAWNGSVPSTVLSGDSGGFLIDLR